MVSLPAGEFTMGDLAAAGDANELPAHSVALSAFAISKYEVTFNQYQVFASATGRAIPNDNAWGKGERPVININYTDAQAYVTWLSSQTGRHFRLPTEAEWEYAARAKSLSLFSFGNQAEKICDYANVADITATEQGKHWQVTGCNDGQLYTAVVGSYRPNNFGLYDLSGNLWEWTADCWNDTYQGAPVDGSQWKSGDCSRHPIRGGSYQQKAESARSSNRESVATDTRSNQIGFRIVEEL